MNLKTFWIVFFVLLIIAATTRLLHLTEFFPNLDDTHVLYAIFFKYDELKQKIYAPENETKPLFQILRTLDSYGIVELIYRPLSVSFLTTFAPMQFFITHLLTSLEDSYQSLLWWGRIPSVFFAIVAIANIGLYFLLSPHQEKKILFIPAMTLMAFSWESIIASQQMHNYCAGLAAISFLILATRKNFQLTSWKQAIFLGSIVGFFSWWQYSMMYYGASLLLYFFLNDAKKKSSLQKVLRYWFITGICFVGVISPLLLILKYTGVLHMSTNYWNIGDNEEYLFKFPDNFLEFPIYALKFFTLNFFETFSAITAFTAYQSTPYYLFSIVLFLLFVIGCAACLFSYKEKTIAFIEFTSITASVLIALILMQKLTLSPTRHQLTLLPFLVILISYGLKFLLDISKITQKVQLFAVLSFSFLVAIWFMMHYPEEQSKRKALYTEKDFKEFLQNAPQKPVLIEYAWTTVAQLMTDVKKEYFVFTAKNLENLPISYPENTQSVIAFNFLGNSPSSDSVWFVKMMQPICPSIKFDEIQIDTLRAIQTAHSFGYISMQKMLKNNMYVYKLSLKENCRD